MIGLFFFFFLFEIGFAKTTDGFRKGLFKCLIATDVAARGLDIEDVGLVIQTQPPMDAET